MDIIILECKCPMKDHDWIKMKFEFELQCYINVISMFVLVLEYIIRGTALAIIFPMIPELVTIVGYQKLMILFSYCLLKNIS